jgi:hypothetical protein
MRHIDHENRADFPGHIGETLKVDAQGIGRRPGDQDAWLVLARQRFHLRVIDRFMLVETIGHNLEPLAGHVERHAMREMATLGEAHAHDRVAGFGKGHQHRLIRLRSGIWLDVGGIGAKQLLQPIDRQLLGDIDVLATTVIALARVTLGILVGQLRALRRHHRVTDVVLGGNQFDVLFLTAILVLEHLPDLGVYSRQGVSIGKHRAPRKP